MQEYKPPSRIRREAENIKTPTACTKFLMYNIFTVNELRTHSLQGKQSNANAGLYPVLPKLDGARQEWLKGDSFINAFL